MLYYVFVALRVVIVNFPAIRRSLESFERFKQVYNILVVVWSGVCRSK